MPETNVKFAKYDVITRLLYLMDNISDDQQFALFKQLFKENVANHLVKGIIDMSDHQRLVLMKHLEEITVETGNSDKRKKPRKDCLINTNMRIQGPRFNSYILDINQFGAYVETNETLRIGQEMKLTFASPDSRAPLNITGKVIRKDKQGVGVKFHNLNHQELNIIRSFAEDTEPVYEINS